MNEHFDKLEVRDPAQREAALMAALPAHLKAAMQVEAMAEALAGFDLESITTRAALAGLPVVRKQALLERQQALRAQDPFGADAFVWHAPRGSNETDRAAGQCNGS